MRTEKIMIATAIIATISACGGGDEESTSQTGSNQQSRTEMTPEVSISFVRAADSKSVEVDYFDRFLLPWAPADTSTGQLELKDFATDTCRRVSLDPNCKGRIIFEAEFPTKVPQQTLKANSKLIVDWENIEGLDFTLPGPINSRWTFTFAEDLSLVSRYTGKFSMSINRTTPTQYSTSDRYELDKLTVKLSDTPGVGYIIDGRYFISPFIGIGLDESEEITFSNWAVTRKARRAGAQVKLRSSTYLRGGSALVPRKSTVTVTVVSSDSSRTEYRVEGRADGDALGTTRTVVGTLDDSGKLVYTAS